MKRPRILVNVFHPDLGQSRGNGILLEAIRDLPNLTVNDVYAHYPDGKIDVAREQKLLLDHDLFVFQHPFYWYSSPALFKEWQDKVFSFGFAYPPGQGDQLNGKHWLSVITLASPDWSYTSGGSNNFTVAELLRPFQQTAYYTGMKWNSPFPVHGVLPEDSGISYTATTENLIQRAVELRKKLETYDLEETRRVGPVLPVQLANIAIAA
ncbi:MAG TPA: NAD(P)H-dependent oxidoreductase [Chthoniobacterales bacterium]